MVLILVEGALEQSGIILGLFLGSYVFSIDVLVLRNEVIDA